MKYWSHIDNANHQSMFGLLYRIKVEQAKITT